MARAIRATVHESEEVGSLMIRRVSNRLTEFVSKLSHDRLAGLLVANIATEIATSQRLDIHLPRDSGNPGTVPVAVTIDWRPRIARLEGQLIRAISRRSCEINA